MLPELADSNPWWTNPDAINEDRNIVAYDASRIHWEPRLKYTFDWQADAVYTVRGPRQVGKTTLIKLMIRDLLRSGVEPRRILYSSCDLVADPKDLVSLIDSYIRYARMTDAGKTSRLYIFLDEISSVKNWQNAIKHLVDGGRLKNATIVLTGSHTIDIRKSSERLPGRRGRVEDTPDKIMLPMRFAEFVETLNQDIFAALKSQNLLSWDERENVIKALCNRKIPTPITELALHLNQLNSLLELYMLTGGIPAVSNEYLTTNSVSEQLFRTYVDVVLGDVMRWDKKESFLRQVVKRIIETEGTPVGWETIAKDTDIAHHSTVADYVQTLSDSFVLSYIYPVNLDTSSPEYRKQKKLYFRDPFIFHALHGWVTGRDPYQSSMSFLGDTRGRATIAECMTCDHLIRLAFQLSPQKQTFSYESSLFYWKSKKPKDYEVDFVLRYEDTLVPIEVKYQERLATDDYSGIYGFVSTGKTDRGILLSKNTLEEKRHAVSLPLSVFLLLI